MLPLMDEHFLRVYTYFTRNDHQAYYFHEYIAKSKDLADRFYDLFLKKANVKMAYPNHGSDKAVTVQLKKYGLGV